MKRSLAILVLVIAVLSQSFAQAIPSLSDFQTTFVDFAKSIAGTLTLNSVAGSTWSDAYIGGFPHFGIGINSSAALAPMEAPKKIFDLLGASLPAPLDSLGMPIPAVAATFKIGLPFIPLDVGIKGGYIPASVGAKLKSATGVGVSYTNIGLTARFALVKQNLLLPNVSIGASYNYQKGSIEAPTGIKSQSLSYVGSNVTLASPNLTLDWSSNTFDFNAQISKTLLFFLTPYVGAGYTVGKSSISGGLNSEITTDFPGGLSALAATMRAAGQEPPDFSNTGLSYSATASDPVLRLYGGFSLNIAVIRLDLQGIYVPKMATQSQAMGLSFSTIFQI